MSLAHFPRLFEAQFDDYTEDLPFWLSLAAAADGPVLELGCGPGRVLFALARAGYAVDGLDNDPAMLDRAHRHLTSDLARRVCLYKADLRDFDLGHVYPLALMPCNTFSHLNDLEATSALAAIRRHLVPGGRVAIELPNPFESLLHDDTDDEPLLVCVEPETGNPLQISAEQEASAEPPRVDVTWHYDELLPDGRVVRTDVSVSHHLRQPEQMRGMLASAGFPLIKFRGDYDNTPFVEDAPRLLIVAQAGPIPIAPRSSPPAIRGDP